MAYSSFLYLSLCVCFWVYMFLCLCVLTFWHLYIVYSIKCIVGVKDNYLQTCLCISLWLYIFHYTWLSMHIKYSSICMLYVGLFRNAYVHMHCMYKYIYKCIYECIYKHQHIQMFWSICMYMYIYILYITYISSSWFLNFSLGSLYIHLHNYIQFIQLHIKCKQNAIFYII